MTDWPPTLPSSPLAGGFRETPPDLALRTQMEAGPAKLRRRTTSGVRQMTVSYLLSAAQVAALDAFYATTLGGGCASFSFAHPRTGAVLDCRFRAPPSYAAANGGYFQATVELEVLP